MKEDSAMNNERLFCSFLNIFAKRKKKTTDCTDGIADSLYNVIKVKLREYAFLLRLRHKHKDSLFNN